MKQALLEDLMIFFEVSNRQSFSKAADFLSINKSTISKRMSRLEANLKIKLIHRSTRKLTLTESGLELQQYCEKIYDLIESAQQSISHYQTSTTGKLRIHSPLSFGKSNLIQAISDFSNEHPEIQIDLSLGGNNIELVAHDLDVGIYVGSPPDSELICRQVGSFQTRVCGSPDYFEKYGMPKSPAQLDQHQCLAYSEKPFQNNWAFSSKQGAEYTVKISPNFVANHSEALCQAAISGLGMTMLPEFAIQEHLESGRLQTVLDDYCSKNIGIYALYLQRHHLNKRVRNFINFLTKRFSLSKDNQTKAAIFGITSVAGIFFGSMLDCIDLFC